ncbi:MAG: DUF4339 domain-containing protein [Waddliaceae bacterium]
MQILFSIILWILFGCATAYFAQQRGRDPTIWFFVGMLLGLIGLLILFILPSYSENESLQELQVTPDSVKTVPEETVFDYGDKQEWYYLDNQRTQIGPVTFDVLKKKWEQGNITKETFLWSEGMSNWQAVGDLGLFAEE